MGERWMTKTEAFAEFDAECANIRWSWSGLSRDKRTVVIILWEDLINDSARPPFYGSPSQPIPPTWTRKPGNRERLKNLKWAIEHCNGLVRAIIAKPNEVPRSRITSCRPDDRSWRITDLDEETGEFRAERVESANAGRT